MYKDDILSGEIKYLEKKKKDLCMELNLLNVQLSVKYNIVNNKKEKFYFEKSLCSSCQLKLSEDEIKYKTIYCYKCVRL